MCKICSIEGCNEQVKAKGLCNRHYKMAKRGKLLSDEAMEKNKALLKEVAEKGNYTLQKDIKNIGKQHIYKLVMFDNGTSNIVNKSCDFVTKDGNMRVPQLMNKECLQDYVEPKYYIYASLLMEWAINSKDCVIRNPKVDNKLVANDMMIKDMFSRYSQRNNMSDRRYKEIMDYLIGAGIIYRTTRITPLSQETTVYLANPLFILSTSCELTPEIFLCFHNILAEKIPEKTMNEIFGLALKSIAWTSECEALMPNREAAEVVFKTNLRNIVKQLGLSSRVAIIENTMDAILSTLGENKLIDEMDLDAENNADSEIMNEEYDDKEDIIYKAKVTPIRPNIKKLFNDSNCTSIPVPDCDYDYDDMD